jgi:hypothetical protein
LLPFTKQAKALLEMKYFHPEYIIKMEAMQTHAARHKTVGIIKK